MPPQGGAPIAPLLDMSSTYAFEDTEEFARASAVKVGDGYVYTRWANPTIDAFEAAIADLEGAEEAEAFGSGMGAISSVFLALCSSGDRIVAARQLYGATFSLLSQRLPRYGISTDFFEVDDYEAISGALPGAAILYCETIGNPATRVADLDRLAELAAGAGVPLVVDNTFASPVLCRPLEHGAAISLHSATKFIGGHHDLMGGVVCTNGPTMKQLRALTRDLGAIMSPFNAWLCLRGLATMHLRVPRSCETAQRIVDWMESRQDIDRVYYPTAAQGPDHDLAKRLLDGRGGGTLGFDVAGGKGRAAAFQEQLRLVLPAASLGGTHSLIVHAASVTHTQLSPDELRAAGMAEGFCRLSVGLEDADDLIADLGRALDAVRQ